MEKKLLWLALSIFVLIALVLASCGPSTTTTTPSTTTTTTTPSVTTTKVPATTTAPTTAETGTTGQVTTLSPETPKYGGTFTMVQRADPIRFDEYWSFDKVMAYYQEPLIQGDWAKGPAGTNQISWIDPAVVFPEYMTGSLAESWDLPDPKTIIFHIRKGIHYALDPNNEASRFVNGREFTADDVIKSWERRYANPSSYISTTIPRSGMTRMDAPDKYTVVLQWTKTPDPGREFEARRGWAFQLYYYMHVEAPEVAKKYGDLRDWRNAVGTGPYMLSDYIPGSMLTFKRNPNYWMNDPLHPENRLPYVETVRSAIIPDPSTRLSALRTGKLDHIGGYPGTYVTREDVERLIETNPELKYAQSLGGGSGFTFRVDKPEQPWYDKRVRHALTMAIDFEGIKNDIYGGQAVYPNFPIAPVKQFIDMGAYIPLEKLPADIQELFSYNPTKAKQLLTDAGYPTGFKVSLVVEVVNSDLAQMIKAYWAAVGVDMEIQLKEPAVYSSVLTGRTYPELIFAGGLGTYPLNLLNYLPADFHNRAMYTGPEMAPKSLELDENYFDYLELGRIFAEFSLYLYDLDLYVNLPQPYEYIFWQPWVQNYHGEIGVGNQAVWNFYKYIWVDMDLKAKMTGR